MIYSEYDLNGMQFEHHRSKDFIYTITKNRTGYTVSWDKDSDSSYTAKMCLDYLNADTWLPINNTKIYDIF